MVHRSRQDRGDTAGQLGDKGLAGEEYTVGTHAVVVLLVVHAVCNHHGLEHIDTTHGSACKEEAQPGKDHPYHRGLYIAVGDLKEHIQQSKRHGACNGIEVINALFLVLANQ